MKPGKPHQKSKQRCQDLGWKVHDRAQSFVVGFFFAHTVCMMYVTKTFLLVSSSVRSKQLLCFVYGQGPTTKKFVEHTKILGGFVIFLIFSSL